MKKKVITQAINKYLKPYLTNYKVHVDLMYKKESDFFLKGYCFDPLSSGDAITVHYFIQPLFVKDESITLGFGSNIAYRKKIGFLKSQWVNRFVVLEDEIEESFKQILSAIILDGEKYLNSINNVEGFYKKFNSEKKDSIRVFEAIAYSSIFFKDMSTQNDLLRRLIKLTSEEEDRHTEWIPQIAKDANLLLNIPSIPQRVEILKSWANETIKNLKLPELLPIK